MKRRAFALPLVALWLFVLAPAHAGAQSDRRSTQVGASPAPPNVITRVQPRIATTQPSSTPKPLAHPRRNAEPREAATPSPFAADARTYAPRYSEPSRRSRLGRYVTPFFVPGDAGPFAGSSEAAPAVADAETLGRLFLDVEPASAQVLVDGIPAGTVADFRGTGMLLTVGLRRIELRAPDYEGTSFDITIAAGQPARYRGELSPVRKPIVEPGAPTARRGPDTFYVIPGCYAGNRPPRERSLPPGCNIARMRTIGS